MAIASRQTIKLCSKFILNSFNGLNRVCSFPSILKSRGDFNCGLFAQDLWNFILNSYFIGIMDFY